MKLSFIQNRLIKPKEDKLRFIRSLTDANYHQKFMECFQKNLKPERDVFLCSFPRSGNGWTRRLIFYYLLKSDNRFKDDITQVLMPDSNKELALRDMAVEVGGKLLKLNELFPESYLFLSPYLVQKKEKFELEINLPVSLIKTHHIINSTHLKTIYLFREKIFSLISYYAMLYRNSIHDNNIDRSHFNKKIRQFALIQKKFLKLTRNYLRKNPGNSLLVIYEDLVSDVQKEMIRILSFLNIKIDQQALNRAIEKFPSMQLPPKDHFLNLLDQKTLDLVSGL